MGDWVDWFKQQLTASSKSSEQVHVVPAAYMCTSNVSDIKRFIAACRMQSTLAISLAFRC